MSTITDAIKKRKKEVGDEEVREIVPVSLDEPDVEVPNRDGIRRIMGIVAVLLVAGALAFGAVMLWEELGDGKQTSGTGSQVAALPGGETEGSGAREAPEEAMPLTMPAPQPEKTAAVSPSTMSTSRTPPREIGVEAPLDAAPTPIFEAPGESTKPAELPIALPPDPFAGITLQGIMRFDPKSPEALINGKALKVGESIGDVKVVEIGEESVRLRCGNAEKVISYR